jgi:hypothetical protein
MTWRATNRLAAGLGLHDHRRDGPSAILQHAGRQRMQQQLHAGVEQQPSAAHL